MTEMTPEEKKALKAKKRKRLILMRRIKVGAVLCAVLALLLYLLCAFVLFKVETVEVIGIKDANGNLLPASNYYTHEEIIKVSGVDVGDSLVRVSKKQVKESLQKILPYIGTVKVKRVYPSTLRIITEDTHALFAADSGGGYTLMDKNFKVLGVAERLPKGSMKLVGISFKNDAVGTTAVFTDEAFKTRINSILLACEEENVTNMTKLDLSNIANVKIVIDSRVTVILGTITDLGDKLSLALKTMDAELQNASDAKIIIDVTDQERSYVRNDYTPIEDEYETQIDETATEIPEYPAEDEPQETPAEDAPEAVG